MFQMVLELFLEPLNLITSTAVDCVAIKSNIFKSVTTDHKNKQQRLFASDSIATVGQHKGDDKAQKSYNSFEKIPIKF